MSLLAGYGEDHQFTNSPSVPDVSTSGGEYRSGSGVRCGVKQSNTGSYYKSNTFQGGARTSCWVTVRIYSSYSWTPAWDSNHYGWFGVGLSGTDKNLMIGSSDAAHLSLYKHDGTTQTTLATEGGAGSLTGLGLGRFDIQITSYGATATINVYLGSSLILTYTGDVTVSGMTNFDSVFLSPNTQGTTGFRYYVWSEMMVTSDDSRAYLVLASAALTGAGTTNDFTNGTYTNINQTTLSDSSPTYDDVNGQRQQYNITDLPSGTWAIAGVVQSARAALGIGSSVAHLKMGVNSGGSVAYGTGATKALTGAYAGYDQVDTVNPVTSAPFTMSEVNALQLNLEAAT